MTGRRSKPTELRSLLVDDCDSCVLLRRTPVSPSSPRLPIKPALIAPVFRGPLFLIPRSFFDCVIRIFQSASIALRTPQKYVTRSGKNAGIVREKRRGSNELLKAGKICEKSQSQKLESGDFGAILNGLLRKPFHIYKFCPAT